MTDLGPYEVLWRLWRIELVRTSRGLAVWINRRPRTDDATNQ